MRVFHADLEARLPEGAQLEGVVVVAVAGGFVMRRGVEEAVETLGDRRLVPDMGGDIVRRHAGHVFTLEVAGDIFQVAALSAEIVAVVFDDM